MRKRRLSLRDVHRVLIVKLSSLGDIIHVTPCIRAIRRALPECEMTAVVDDRYARALQHNPHLDRIIETKSSNENRIARFLKIRRQLREVRRQRFDLAIDFQGLEKSAMWVYASGARFKAGRGSTRLGWSLVVHPDLTRHAVEVCAEIAEAIGFDVTNLEPEVFITREEESELEALLQAHGLPESGFLVFSPFNRRSSKVWPAERYAELGLALHRDTGLPIAISGSPLEVSFNDTLNPLFEAGAAVSLVGKTTVGQAFALYRRARLLVAGDTGPAHAAAALATPVVALFGPTLPERTRPWGAAHTVVQKLRPATHDAYHTDSAGIHISAIDVDSVYDAVMAKLGAVTTP